MENKTRNAITIDALDIAFLSLDSETMECPPTPRLKVIDLFLGYEKPTSTPLCDEVTDDIEEENLLFRGQDYTTSGVDCGESGGLGLGIAVF